MRILQVHTRYRQPGGEDRVVQAEAELLRSGGHEVFEFHADNPASAVASARLLARSPWNTDAAKAVERVARDLRPDIAHVHNTWFALSPAILSSLRRAGVPVVMTLHNYRLLCANAQLFRDGAPCEDCVGSHPWHGVAHRCYRRSALASAAAASAIALHRRRGTWARNVDLFLAPTGFARDVFIRGGIPADRIQVKYHFSDDPGPRSSPASASQDVLYVGRLSPEKGAGMLVDAFSATGEKTGLRLVIVGEGPARRELEGRAGPNVTFAGALSPADVQQVMLHARALVFPSFLYETFGLSMVEAMAAGLPVVAADIGVAPEIVGDGGWLVPSLNEGSWHEALLGLTRDAEIDGRGSVARRRWEQAFSRIRALRRLESAYQNLGTTADTERRPYAGRTAKKKRTGREAS